MGTQWGNIRGIYYGVHIGYWRKKANGNYYLGFRVQTLGVWIWYRFLGCLGLWLRGFEFIF